MKNIVFWPEGYGRWGEKSFYKWLGHEVFLNLWASVQACSEAWAMGALFSNKGKSLEFKQVIR